MLDEFKGANAFYMIPVGLVQDDDLMKKPKSILLAGEIFSMLNATGKFYMSNKELAKRLKVSTVTIADYLNLLENKELIARTTVKNEAGATVGRQIYAGKKLASYISVGWLSPLNRGDKADLTGGSKAHLTDPVKPTLHKYNREYNNEYNNIYIATDVDAGVKGEQVSEQPKPPKRDIEAEFNELWQDYPKKQGKKQALKHYIAWKKLSKENTLGKAKKQLDNYKKYVYSQRNRGFNLQFKNGSTWFNGGIDDDYSDPKPVTTEPEGFGAPESHAIDQGDSGILDIPDDELPF